MDSRRSYLDSLNEGRQRKPSASLEHLSRSLEQLEKQLSMRQRAQGAVRAHSSDDFDDDLTVARINDRFADMRRSDVYESVERFTHEFQALKAEMLNSSLARQDYIREQVASEMRREFEILRRELEHSYESANAETALRLDKEIARLGKTLQQSRDRHDDKSLNLLRLEIEQIKGLLGGLAREESVRAVGARWEEIERTSTHPDFDQAIETLSLRLEQIGDAVAALPAQIPVGQIDAKLRNLAEQIEQFVQIERETSEPAAINAIERRLEEISRAIVAISLADQKNAFDPAMIDRLDARISRLSSQIEDATAESDAAILQKMDELAERIESLAQAGISTAGTGDIAREIAQINERLATASFPVDVEQLEERIATMFDRVAEQSAQSASEDAFLSLQERLDSLHSKFDASQSEPLDPALIRALEAQLTALSAHLDQPSPVVSELASLAPRIERIEAAVSESRDELVETARLAAEEVLRNFAGSPLEAETVAGLADDLKALESLTRDADDRNTRTFDAIHETLIKIIDRIGQLDTGKHSIAETADIAPLALARKDDAKLDVGHAPSLDMDEVPPLEAGHDASDFGFDVDRQPAPEDELDATLAPIEPATRKLAGETVRDEKESRTWPRLFRRKDGGDGATGADATPETFDTINENEPLEPGKAPDIQALIRRVREERPAVEKDDDPARSDFIAAARRAAHAAVAEADLMKKEAAQADGAPERKSIFAGILKVRRKTLLLAAAAIISALAGLQLGKSFVKDPVEIAGNGTVKAVSAFVETPKAEPVAPIEPAKSVEVVKASPAEQAAAKPDVSAETTASINPASPERRMGDPIMLPVAPSAEPVEEAAPEPVVAPAPIPAAKPGLLQEIPVKVGPQALRDAARNGDAKAIYVVGTQLAEGAGLSSDMPEASRWFEKSAELGFAPAQYRIGNLYEKGLGVTRNLDKAKQWYKLAAGQGNAFAMHNLGVLYATLGENEQAVRWFNKAATLGIKDSQYNLGILAAKGAGTPRNMELAYKWFGVVAATGDADAAAKRDEIAKSMSPEQLARARSLVDNWRTEAQDPQANQVQIPDDWQERTTSVAQVDVGKAVRNVQALLNKAGYDAGMADGLIGNRTRQAIAAFQEDHGLKPTGRIDEHMVRALLAKN